MGAEYKVHTKLLTEFETLGGMGENCSGIINRVTPGGSSVDWLDLCFRLSHIHVSAEIVHERCFKVIKV